MFSGELRGRLMNVHAFVVTPFMPENPLKLNVDGLRGNLKFLVDNGVKVLAVAGGTGEIDSLSDEELGMVAEVALDEAGDKTLVIPALPDNVKRAIEMAKIYGKLGAEVVLGMAPYIRHRVPGDLSGVFNYYKTVAEATDLAILPYNTQGWSPEFMAKMATIDKIIGVKDPCRYPHNLFISIRKIGDRFVWIGNKRHEPEVLQYRYQAGIHGFTAGIINFIPKFELEMHEAGMRRDWERLIDLQRKLAPISRLRAKYGDAALPKAGLDLIGLAGGPVRPPRVNITDRGIGELKQEMQKLGYKF